MKVSFLIAFLLCDAVSGNIPCPFGFYGDACTQTCGHCKHLSECNNIDGQCNGTCKPGFQRNKCDAPCSAGFYGDGCRNKCGHCKRITDCTAENGTCTRGCSEGYMGPKCDYIPDLLQRDGAVQFVLMSPSSPNMTGKKAYDGNPSRDPEQCQCCSQTLNSESSWWMVTFQHTYPIGKIFIHGRDNEDRYHHIGGFSAELGNRAASETTWKVIYTGKTSDVVSDYEIDVRNELASSVRIRRVGVLTICEIQIIGGEALSCDRLGGICQTPRFDQELQESNSETRPIELIIALWVLAAGIVITVILISTVLLALNRKLCFREDVYATPKRTKGTEADTYDTLHPIPDAPIQMEERHVYSNELIN